jgi:hypothetical protein
LADELDTDPILRAEVTQSIDKIRKAAEGVEIPAQANRDSRLTSAGVLEVIDSLEDYNADG